PLNRAVRSKPQSVIRTAEFRASIAPFKDVPEHAGTVALRAMAYRAIWALERLLLRWSAVPCEPFIDSTFFPWLATLQESSDAISAELEQLLKDQRAFTEHANVRPDAGAISSRTAWRSFFFLSSGRWSKLAESRCPETTQLLRSVPQIITAYFSMLGPRTSIKEHRGPWRGQLRLHLGIKVPSDPAACTLTVGGIERAW